MARTVGLRTEILTTLTLLMGAALLLGGVLMLRFTEQGLLQQRLAQVDAVSQMLAKSLYQQESTRGSKTLSAEVLHQLPESLHYTAWWLYDHNLQLHASLKNATSISLAGSRLQQVKLSRHLERTVEFPSLLEIWGEPVAQAKFLVPIVAQNRFVGLLEIDFSLEDIRFRLLSSQWVMLLYVILYGSVLIFIGYYLLQRNVIKPASDLLLATEDVAQGNFENRLPVAGPLEISRLANAYNQMVEALAHSRQEAQSSIEALELTNQDLRAAREEVIRSEKLASVGQLAAGLAHELGNPLAALVGYLEILKGRLRAGEDLDILRRSQVEAERIDFLVRELLDFSRPGDSSVELLDPAVEIRNCLDLLRNQGFFSSLDVIDQLPNSLPRVRFNVRKFQQVFINLLLNAAYACGDGGQIQLAALASDRDVELKLIDDGCGIPASFLKKVFDPFVTTKPTGEGTGLGLAICHRLVDEMGGTIELESTEGQGTCCRVTLPIVVN